MLGVRVGVVTVGEEVGEGVDVEGEMTVQPDIKIETTTSERTTISPIGFDHICLSKQRALT